MLPEDIIFTADGEYDAVLSDYINPAQQSVNSTLLQSYLRSQPTLPSSKTASKSIQK